jgi:hypothetical protein
MENYSQYVLLAFLGLFLLAVVLGLIVGLVRGWKRGLLRFGIILLCVLIAFFIAQPIASSVSNLQIEGNTIKGHADAFAQDISGRIENFVQLPPTVQAAVLSLPLIFLNVFVFVIAFMLLQLVSLGVFAILKGFLFSKERAKEAAGQKVKKGRLLGGAIGVLQGLVIALVIMVPFAAYANAATVFSDQIDRDRVEKDSMVGMVLSFADVLSLYQASAPGIIFGAIGVDKLFYDPLTTLKIGDERVSMEDFALLAGVGLDAFASHSALFEGVKNGDKEASAEFIEILREGVSAVLNNGFVKFVMAEAAKIETTAAVNQILADAEGNLMVLFDEVFDLFLEFNQEGVFGDIMTIFTAGFDAIVNAEEAELNRIGKAIDRFLDLTILENTKEQLFALAINEGDIANAMGQFAPDQNIKVELHLLRWERALVSVSIAAQMAQADYNREANFSRDIDRLIGSLVYQCPTTRADELFESILTKMIIDMNVKGIDEAYMHSKTLEMRANRQGIVLLSDLMVNNKTFGSFADTNNLKQNEKELDQMIETLGELEDVLVDTTDDFTLMVNDIFAGMMGGLEQGKDTTIASFRRSLVGYRHILNAQQEGNENFDADKLVQTLLDGDVLDMLERNDGTITGISDENMDAIEEAIDNARTDGGDPDLIERLEKLLVRELPPEPDGD